MPWNKTDYPKSFKNIPEKERNRLIRIAEAIRKKCVEDGGDEGKCAAKAIRIALSRRKGGGMSETLAEPTRLSQIVQNFNNKVRGIDIAIDVSHAPQDGAAGWIKRVELRSSSKDPDRQSLYGFVEWTDYGREIVGRDKRYRYISAEFDEYEDPETQQKFEDVLLAATVTNRPFVKWMEPIDQAEDGWIEILREGDYYDSLRWRDGKKSITLSEEAPNSLLQKLHSFVGELLGKTTEPQITNEVSMDKIREFLVGRGAKLEEEATEDQVLEALTSELAAKDTEIAELKEQAEAEPVVEPDEETEQLAETNTKLEEEKTKLSERVQMIETEFAKTKAELAETKKNAFFEDVLHAGKLTPAERKDFEALYDKAPEEVCKMLKGRTPVVSLTEQGSSSDQTSDKMDEFIKKVNKLAEDKNISREDAFEQLAEEMPTESDE